MECKLEWQVFDRDSGQHIDTLTTQSQFHTRQAVLGAREVIRPVTGLGDHLPPANASCTVSEWLAYEIRTQRAHHAAAWARKDHAESARAEQALDRALDQLTRLANAGEFPSNSHPNCEATPREVALTSALARCRDAFPVPEQGSDLESIWGQACGDPESVPDYLAAIAAAHEDKAQERYEAADEKVAFDTAFTPEYLANRQAIGVDDVVEFAFSVWCHARRPLLGLAQQKSRNEILADAARALEALGHPTASGLLHLLMDATPAPFTVPSKVSALASSLEGTLPQVGSVWQHHNGNRYMVFVILNRESDRQDEYPTTIGYVGSNGKVWARPLSRWHRSMTLLAAPAA